MPLSWTTTYFAEVGFRKRRNASGNMNASVSSTRISLQGGNALAHEAYFAADMALTEFVEKHISVHWEVLQHEERTKTKSGI